MLNSFKENRQKVQLAFLKSKFLVPLTKEHLPFEIKENKATDQDSLKSVFFDNLPFSDSVQITYVLNLELDNQLFSLPQNKKTVEKAFLIFTCSGLYVILVEMKTSLQGYNTGIQDIKDKIKHSIGRIALFLTHYVLDNDDFNEYPLNFITVIPYNKENITQAVSEDKRLNSEEFVSIFLKEKGKLFFDTTLNSTFVEMFFVPNPGEHPNEIHIDFNQLFNGNDDWENAIYSDKTLS